MSDGEVLVVIIEIMKGLGLQHDLGYAHRDIKMDNIMVDPDGQLRVSVGLEEIIPLRFL